METKTLSDDRLVLALGQLAARGRHNLVDFLEHLVEFDRRLLHLRLGHRSLFEYLLRVLHFSKGSASRRITAARLLARYPEIGPLLREGHLHLVGLCMLRDVLSDDNHEELLGRVKDFTEEEIELLVATLRPKTRTRDSIRTASSIARLAMVHSAVQTENGSTVEPNLVDGSLVRMIVPIPRARLSSAHPVSGELCVLKVTVDREFMGDLERVKEALSHKVKGGKLDEILHECIRMTLATCEKRQRGKVSKDRTSARTSPKAESTEAQDPPDSRYIPTAVRREVWERDEGACTYVGSSGMRCNARRRLEIHHLQPFALGGPPVASNLTLHCKAHNLLIMRDELAGSPAPP